MEWFLDSILDKSPKMDSDGSKRRRRNKGDTVDEIALKQQQWNFCYCVSNCTNEAVKSTIYYVEVCWHPGSLPGCVAPEKG